MSEVNMSVMPSLEEIGLKKRGKRDKEINNTAVYKSERKRLETPGDTGE